MALHTAHRIMRNLFFGRVVDKMSRTGPIDDLDLLVKLATRGYWHAIAPIQNPRELLALLRILKQARPRGILEIGTAGGGTLFAFTRIAAADAQLVSIDLPGGPGGGGYPPSRTRLYQEFPLSGQRLELIREDSHDPAVRAAPPSCLVSAVSIFFSSTAIIRMTASSAISRCTVRWSGPRD